MPACPQVNRVSAEREPKATRKALLIAYQYPPRNGCGPVRPAMMAKWLPKFGWDTAVICGHWTAGNSGQFFDSATMPESQARVVATVDPGGRRPVLHVLRDLKAFAAGLARMEGARWRALPASLAKAPPSIVRGLRVRIPAVIRAEMTPYEFTQRLLAVLPDVIERERPSVLWATSPPPGTHSAALVMSRRFSIPWVADFRDIPDQRSIWVGNGGGLRAYWARHRQYRVATQAAAAVTVSPALAEALRSRLSGPVHVIPNGFDPAEHKRAVGTGRASSDRFAITYTGIVYPRHRDPKPLFAAIDYLAGERKIDLRDIAINFWCSSPASLKRLSSGFKSDCCVSAFNFIPRGEALETQRSSDVLLMLAHGRERGVYTSKIFEYLGARRPILCIPGDGDCVDALLQETGAGVSCSSVDEIAAVLLRWYQEWKATGTVRYQGRDEAVMRYTREAQAEALAEILDSVVAPRGRPFAAGTL